MTTISSTIIIVLLVLQILSSSVYAFKVNHSIRRYNQVNSNIKCYAMIELQTGEFDKEVIQRYYNY